jgi:hypothetical protein
MVWLLFIFISPAFAQIDLSAIKKLDSELPNYEEHKQFDEETESSRYSRINRPPKRIVRLEEIKNSGTELGAIKQGATLRELESNKNFTVTKLIYVRYFKSEDENGFKYLQDKDGSIKWRVYSHYVEPMKNELVLYEPPLRYTPAPDDIVRAEYDQKLSVPPEFSIYTGKVQGDFMKDLFEDNKAQDGVSNQYGVHFFTDWKLPIKAGAVIHFERATYHLTGGGEIDYTSLSFGPQFKTREFEIFSQPIRFQSQFRFSPFAKATAETTNGPIEFKFNSSDLLSSLERPIKNSLGEFVLGLYVQFQWLNIKDQTRNVSVSATNEMNKSIGLSFAQVFQ